MKPARTNHARGLSMAALDRLEGLAQLTDRLQDLEAMAAGALSAIALVETTPLDRQYEIAALAAPMLAITREVARELRNLAEAERVEKVEGLMAEEEAARAKAAADQAEELRRRWQAIDGQGLGEPAAASA